MPPEHDRGPVAAFCGDLRELRRASGRDLAGLCREINLSRAQLYAVLNGEVKRPPDFARLVEPFVRACGAGDEAVAEWRRRHDVLVRVYEELRKRSRAEPAAVPVVPAQLPPATAAFSGRSAELARLDHLLPRSPGAAVVISAVSGTAGVGKTALAVHWAHRVAERFPDGQLYVNLRGFGPDGRVTDPADALRGFLEALGATRIPAERDARTALYRSMIAGKRILVLLDNARDADQVRPLGPRGGLADRGGGGPAARRRGGRPVLRRDHLDRFGDARLAAGAAAEARGLWEKAARMLTELGHHKAGEVREKLGRAGRSAA